MTRRARIYAFSSRLLLSLLLPFALHTAVRAQGFLRFERDSVPMFRGVALSFDLVGLAELQVSDYGQYEGAVRVNLHDQYLPVAEVGYGRANHKDDEVTGISYRTSAPYFRLGCDFNILKRKHTGNLLYVGLRYAATYYKVDLERQDFPDPVWQWPTGYGVVGEKCYQHWAEVVFGLDTKVAGPLRMGWSFRYRRRLFGDDGVIGNTWYVPGFGTAGTTRLGGTFNVMLSL